MTNGSDTDQLNGVEKVNIDGQVYDLVDQFGAGVGGYQTIQDGVDDAGDGDIVLVAGGTYTEQVVVDSYNDLTIQAAPSETVDVVAPADVVQYGTSSSGRALNSVISVQDSTNIQLVGLNVDGAGHADTVDGPTANFIGVSYRNASGGLTDVDITGIRDPYPGGTTVGGHDVVSGNQRGVGLEVDNDTLMAFAMSGGSITDFQKNATVFNHADLDVHGVTITGGGAQTINAQNGIQVGNSTGAIYDNNVAGIGYAGAANAYSGGILVTGGNTGLSIHDNTVVGTNGETADAKVVGIYVYDGNGANDGGGVTDNDVSFCDTGVGVYGGIGTSGFDVLGNSVTDVDLNDPYALLNPGYGGVDFEPDGSGTAAFNVQGSEAADYMTGAAAGDSISGLAGDDFLGGLEGNDALDGGAGYDIALYSGTRSDYTITKISHGVYSITDDNAGDGDDGTDMLTSIEGLQFDGNPGVTFKLDSDSPDPSPYYQRFHQSFASDTSGILDDSLVAGYGTATRTADGVWNGVNSADGDGYYAVFENGPVNNSDSGPYTEFDGYRANFKGGFDATLQIYLDPTLIATGEGFDVSLAATGQDGFHRRDFIFHVTHDTSTGDVLIGASNNSSNDPVENLETGNHGVANTAGWYTFEYNFYENGDGDLEVGMDVYDTLGNLVFSDVRSDASDDISSVVGGNRYLWFPNIDVANGIAVDDVTLTTADTNPVQLIKGTGTQLGGINPGTILDSFATIGGAVAASETGNIVDLAAGDYSAEGLVDVTVDGLTFRGPAGAVGADLAFHATGVQTATLDGAAPINVTGNDLGDTIVGNDGNNVLTGGAGIDALTGGGGDDTLDGLGGADDMTGGLGDDTYGVDDAGDSVTENSGEGTDTVMASITYTLGDNLENLTLTGSDNIDGTGNSLDNIITGNSGNNRLDGDTGADSMAGGAGDDTYVVNSADDSVSEAAGHGTDTVESSISYALGANVENLVLTGAALNGTGNGLANTITGNALGNTLKGKGGLDTLIGGDGNDVYIVGNSGDAVVENAGEGFDTVRSSANYTLSDNVERLILTGKANHDGTGNAMDNLLIGNSGKNTLNGGLGADDMSGRRGNDTYVVNDSGDAVHEDPGKGYDTVVSSIDYALGDNLERLKLVGGAINGTGNSHRNTIYGDDQDNSLLGAGGGDKLFGSSGDDTLSGGQGSDSLYGGTGADVLVGGDGNDLLSGDKGADTMIGGAGDDFYIVNSAHDTVTEAANEGTDTVRSYVSYALTDNVEKLQLHGTGNIDGTGNDENNTISGNGGDNTLNGGNGDDTLSGGAGNDVLVGGAGKDTMTGGAGDDKFVFNSLSDMGNSNATNDIITDFQSGDVINLSGVDADSGTVGDQAFTLIGSAAFSGAAGELRLYHHNGNTYVAGDVDGDGAADFQIRLTGFHSLGADSFVL